MSFLSANKRRVARAAVRGAVVWVVAQLCAPSASAAPSLEYVVKANYLYKFAPFVAWPDQVFADPSVPLVICVAGDNPFGGALDEAVHGQTFKGRPVVVRKMATVEPGAACHVLFLSSHITGQSRADALKAVAGQPVLTVSDGHQGNDGSVIQFVTVDGHVRFDIDSAAARAGGLTISSKLLSLAVSHRKPGV